MEDSGEDRGGEDQRGRSEANFGPIRVDSSRFEPAPVLRRQETGHRERGRKFLPMVTGCKSRGGSKRLYCTIKLVRPGMQSLKRVKTVLPTIESNSIGNEYVSKDEG